MIEPRAKHARAAQLAPVLVRHDVVGVVGPRAVIAEVAERPARREPADEHAVAAVRLARGAPEHVVEIAPGERGAACR